MGRRFELGDRFWEIERWNGVIRLRWGRSAAVQNLQISGDEAKVEELVGRQLAEGYREVEPVVVDAPAAPVAVPEWHARFERGAAYIELGLRDCVVRQRRGDTLAQELDSATRYRSRDEAREQVERIAKLALENGFVVVREGLPALPEPAFEPMLEADCLGSPDDPAPWAVYADWLIAQGDVRGELAALQLGERTVEADALLRARRAELFGVHADVWVDLVELTWTHGFVSGARITPTMLIPDELVRELLALPLAKFVTALAFPGGDLKETLDVILASPQRPRIRELRIDGGADAMAIFGRFPALDTLELRLDASIGLAGFTHPTLRRLAGAAQIVTTISDLAGASLPALVELSLVLGETREWDAPVPWVAIGELLASDAFPGLAHLALRECEYLDPLITVLAGSKRLKQLRTLDLSGGNGGRAAATTLANAASTFAHLDWIDVTGNRFTTAMLAQITRALPNVRAGEQQVRESVPQPRKRKRSQAPEATPVIRRRR